MSAVDLTTDSDEDEIDVDVTPPLAACAPSPPLTPLAIDLTGADENEREIEWLDGPPKKRRKKMFAQGYSKCKQNLTIDISNNNDHENATMTTIKENIEKKDESKRNKLVTPKRKTFECDVCNKSYLISQKQDHCNSVLHLMNVKTKENETQLKNGNNLKQNKSSKSKMKCKRKTSDKDGGINQTNKGYQLLCKMGWNQESGLGKELQGRTEPVKTLLKVGKHLKTGLGSLNNKEKEKFYKVTHFPSQTDKKINDEKAKARQTKSNKLNVDKKSKDRLQKNEIRELLRSL